MLSDMRKAKLNLFFFWAFLVVSFIIFVIITYFAANYVQKFIEMGTGKFLSQ